MLRNSVLVKCKDLRSFCTYRFLFGMSYSMILPVIPLFFNSIGIGTVMLGIIMSLYGVIKTIAQIPFGIFSGLIGDKLTLKLALGLMAVVPIVYIYSNNSFVVGSIYIIQGGILGMAAPATYSILSRSLDVKRRGESTGIAAAMFTIGGGVGAAIAGLLVAKISNFDVIFTLAFVGLIISLIYLVIKVPKVKVEQDRSESFKLEDILKEIGNKKLGSKILVLASIAFLGDYIYGCVLALFHFYGRDVLGTTTSFTSSIIAVYLIVFGLGAPIAGFVSDRIGNKNQLMLAFFIMNITLFFLVVIREKWLFAIVIIFYFLGATFLNASLQSELSQFGHNPKIRGCVFGVVGGFESLGFALGPVISAYIYENNNELLFLGLFAVSLIVTLIYLLNLNKSRIE